MANSSGRSRSVVPYIAALAAGAGGLLFLAGRRRELSFRGQVALITGGSRGLGFILAQQLVAQGAKVAVCARKREELERAQRKIEERGGRLSIYVCDVSQRDAVSNLVRAVARDLGPIDLLVNCAGIMQVGPIENVKPSDFQSAMDANFWGMLHTSLAVLPDMHTRLRGRIVNVTSIGGVLAAPHMLPYTSSKFAAVGFSKGLNLAASRWGVQVTTVVPWFMRTGSYGKAEFLSDKKGEVAWFSLGATLPLISLDAEKAARRILSAAARGRAVANIGVQARVASALEGLAPNTVARVSRAITRVLPGGGERREGRMPASLRILTTLGERAASKFNEKD